MGSKIFAKRLRELREEKELGKIIPLLFYNNVTIWLYSIKWVKRLFLIGSFDYLKILLYNSSG